jgi:hypothetical protein
VAAPPATPGRWRRCRGAGVRVGDHRVHPTQLPRPQTAGLGDRYLPLCHREYTQAAKMGHLTNAIGSLMIATTL